MFQNLNHLFHRKRAHNPSQNKTRRRRLLLESLEDRRLLAVITVEPGDSAAETLAETDTTLSVSGTLSVEDPDVSDTVDAAVESVSVTGDDNGIGNAALLAMMTVGPNPVIDSSSTTGTIDWTFDSGGEAFDYLADDESLQLEYTLSATDGVSADPTLGDSAANPGLSAKHILANRPGAADGVYWIDPDGPGGEAPVEVYADMTTDGGGWTQVASTKDITLNDQASLYYSDLTTLSPVAGHEGIWNGMRPVALGNSDIRFSARANVHSGPFDVDLAFYDIHWYDELTSSFNDADIGFEQLNGAFDTQPPPARRNLLNGDFRPLGDQWNEHGYLEGEDQVHDTGDFTVDFDDRGMDSNQSDGTDWGEDDHEKKAGVSGVAGGTWHIWVRELTAYAPVGTTVTQPVVITIDGTNDQPDITVEAGDSAAETLVETDTTLSAAGSLSVADPDITDTVSASVVSVVESGDATGMIDNVTLLAMMTLASSSVIDGASTSGIIDWTFDSGGEAFDHVADGESLVLTYTIQATDDSGAASEPDSDTQTVVITIDGTNDEPAMGIMASSHATLETKGTTDSPVTVDGEFFDVDISDTHMVTIDWGEVAGPSDSETFAATEIEPTQYGSFTRDHTYSSGGIFTITITIDDGNGGVIIDTRTTVITGVGLVDGTLYVIGTDGKDQVDVILVGGVGPQVVVVAKLDKGGPESETITFNETIGNVNRIEMHLCAGDDRADLGGSDGGLTVPALIFGGDGDDDLKGGGGNDMLIGGRGDDKLKGYGGQDVLSGGDGDDDLKGGDGNDLLIGGLGKDKLKGEDGDDLLIAYSVANEENVAALDAALANWLGGSSSLALMDLGPLTPDGVKDDLRGGSGDDELFGSAEDKLKP